jgi:streptogrisin D
MKRSRLFVLPAVTLLLISFNGQATAAKPGEQLTAVPAGAPIATALDTTASAIQDRALRTEIGFAGLSVDRRAETITLHAKDLTAARALVAAVPGTAAMKIDLRAAQHSRSELKEAADLLWKSAANWNAAGAIKVHSISINPDGSGLEVRANDVAAASAVATSSVPLRFEKGADVVPASRYDDDPPFSGGIHIGRGGGSLCSSAFGVRQGAQTFLMTAAHCYQGGVGDGPVQTGMGGHHIGYVSGWDSTRDAASVGTNAWSGVWTNDSSWTHYRDSAWSYNTNEICQSGVHTGYTCGIFVVNQLTSWTFTGWPTPIYGVKACAPQGFFAVRPGDSGGPVYDWHADGKLRSRGIISAGDPELATTGRSRCMYFTETNAILNSWSQGTTPVTLLTSP